MTDREKALLWLNSFVKNKEPMTLIPKQLIRLMYDVLKEQEHLLNEYENLSQVLFKIEKYFKIADLSSLVDGIENGRIVVLQDDGHFIGGTPIAETTIKIRRL